MRSELRAAPHGVLSDEQVFEIWYDGRLIGQVTAGDGPVVRVISKYEMDTVPEVIGGPPFATTVVLRDDGRDVPMSYLTRGRAGR